MSHAYNNNHTGTGQNQPQARYVSQYPGHVGATTNDGNTPYPTQQVASTNAPYPTQQNPATNAPLPMPMPYPSGGPVYQSQQSSGHVSMLPNSALPSLSQQRVLPPSHSAQYATYNPQEYAQPMSPPAPLYAPSTPTFASRPSNPPLDYNPADYAASNYYPPPSGYYAKAQSSYLPPSHAVPSQEPTRYPQHSPRRVNTYSAASAPPNSQQYSPSRLRSQTNSQPPPAPPQHSHSGQSHPYLTNAAYSRAETPSPLPGLAQDYSTSSNLPTASYPDHYYPEHDLSHQRFPPTNHPLRMPSPGPPPPPPAHGNLQRSNTLLHPQLRPLPGPPSSEIEPDFGADYFLQRPDHDQRDDYTTEEEAQDELFNQVESAVIGAARASAARRRSSLVDVQEYGPSSYSPHGLSPRHSNLLSPNRASITDIIDGYSDNDDVEDAEALAGLEAMRMADQQDAVDEARRRSAGAISTHDSVRSQSRFIKEEDLEEEGDFSGVDMTTLGGGYDARMAYGDEPLTNGAPNIPPNHLSSTRGSRSSPRRSHASSNTSLYGRFYDSAVMSHPSDSSNAQVDVGGGTGGLFVPERRQSYDEGDEDALMEYAPTWEPPELFFHPEPSSTHRPLPPPPPSAEDSMDQLDSSFQAQPLAHLYSSHPMGPAGYERSTTDPNGWVPRSASLISREPAPVPQPVRAKTDAEERRFKPLYRSATTLSAFENTPATPAVAVDLPSLPTRRFNPAKLGNADFKKCDEPWSLGSILRWLLNVADPEKIAELREAMVKDAIVALFTNKVPTMNIADAETLSTRVVDDMYSAGTMVKTEEWVRLIPGEMNGVIFQLTMAGCYSPTVHSHIIPGRCYSHHCHRTLKKVSLQAVAGRAKEDWATFYGLKKEDVEGKDRKEIELQNNLHEIVQSEDIYMENLDVLVQLYRDPLIGSDPSIINPKRVTRFIADVFGKVEAVRKANEEHLLPQLKYRQMEQGPWVKGFSDIFRQWIRKAKTAYIDYASGLPAASLLMRQEIERNLEFRNFVDRVRAHKMSNKLGWDNFVKAPITRLQRYGLLLQTVHKNMIQDSEEKTNLQTAIDEIKAVTLECDHRVADMQAKVDLMDLQSKLCLRKNMQNEVELNLNYLGRELIYRGDLQRAGQTRLSWVDTHAILFDHYLVLSKIEMAIHKGSGVKIERYDVSRLPIPMDLLVLETPNEDAVVKSSYVRGITSVTALPVKSTASPDPTKLARTSTGLPRSESLQQVNSSTSLQPLSTSAPNASSKIAGPTVLDGPKDSEKIMYPFRVHHLGKEIYTLFAPTAANRSEWCRKIIEAKTKHAAALYSQNAEPLRLRVMADSAFYSDTHTSSSSSMGKPVVIQGTPTDRAIKEVEHRFRATGRPQPICRARVNCATSFTTPYPGKHMIAVGTDFGVFVSEMDNPRGWTRAIPQIKVTQMAILEEFSLCILLADKSLIAYHLDILCPTDQSGPGTSIDAVKKAPQKLSGSRDVGFFAVGRMKDRTLVFYKKKEGVSSIFKVLEPVFAKTTEKKRGVFKRGTTDFFREYDDFYVGTECTGINLFQNSLAVSTDRGFEVLTLDKKQPWGVPDWKAPEVANIATHVERQTTLGMLRLNEQEFLLCYEKCAVYVNKHGEVCRSVVMNFVAKARAAALYGPYLILFDTDFVEIRNAQNGRLKQIIAGRDIKCLDDGGGGTLSGGSSNTAVVNGVSTGLGAASRTVKVVMQHPEQERIQIVVELVLNDGLKE